MSYVLSLALQSAQKRPSVLHEIEAWGTSSDSSPLFFVREHRLNIQMLVDKGATCSLLPLSCIDHRSLTNADRETVTSIGLGSIPVFGISLQRIDLGFSQLYEQPFYAVDLDYGVLGADFLLRYGLNVNLSTQRLFRLPEVERCCLSNGDPSQTFFPSSTSTSKNIILS